MPPMSTDYTAFMADNLFLFGLLFALLAAIVYTESKRLTKKYQDISPAEMVQMMNHEDAVILDVREDSERTGSVIRNAKHFASSVLPKRLDELGKAREKPVIAFCANGLAAQKMCQLLARSGFSRVYHLKGGLAAWEQASMPVVKP